MASEYRDSDQAFAWRRTEKVDKMMEDSQVISPQREFELRLSQLPKWQTERTVACSALGTIKKDRG